MFHEPEDTVFFVIISRGYGGQGVFFDDGRGTLDFTGVPALRIRGLYKEKERDSVLSLNSSYHSSPRTAGTIRFAVPAPLASDMPRSSLGARVGPKF
jgi:hypothetical protein